MATHGIEISPTGDRRYPAAAFMDRLDSPRVWKDSIVIPCSCGGHGYDNCDVMPLLEDVFLTADNEH
jgi:hypothetical protein